MFGVSYGFSKQRSLTYYVKERNEQNARRKYEDLVEEAKLAFEAQEKKEEAELAAKDGGNSLLTQFHVSTLNHTNSTMTCTLNGNQSNLKPKNKRTGFTSSGFLFILIANYSDHIRNDHTALERTGLYLINWGSLISVFY